MADQKPNAAEAKVTGLVKTMKEKFKDAKKVTIKIPIDKQNPDDLTVFAQINGYPFTMKRGEEIEVPVQIKKLLERAGII